MECRNGLVSGMSINVHIDSAGRVVMPKKVRERFGLRGGDTLILEVTGDAIQLQPRPAKTRLKRVNGVLVVVSDMPLAEAQDLVASPGTKGLGSWPETRANEGFLRHQCDGGRLSRETSASQQRPSAN